MASKPGGRTSLNPTWSLAVLPRPQNHTRGQLGWRPAHVELGTGHCPGLGKFRTTMPVCCSPDWS